MEHIKSTVGGVKSHMHAVKDHLVDKIDQIGKEKSFGKQISVDVSVSAGIRPEEKIDPRHRH